MAKTKMTPQQEARYALDYGLSREDLPAVVQQEYDRLVQEPRLAPPAAPPVPEWQQYSGLVIKDARRAADDGLPVFIARIPQGWQRADIGTAGLLKPSALVAQIEALGWQLDQMSWVSRNDWARAEGFFLFRRQPPLLS